MTISNPFSAPAEAGSGDYFKPKDNLGALVIIKPLNYERAKVIDGFDEPTDTVTSNVWAIDGPNAGEAWDESWITSTVLVKQLRPRIGELVIGRIGQGEAKKGRTAPWILKDPTEEDIQKGVEAWTKIQSGQFATPAAANSGVPF